MRKLFYLMLVVLGAAASVSCSKDDNDDFGDSQKGIITMTIELKDGELDLSNWEWWYNSTFNEGDTITIDWGDGVVEQYISQEYYRDHIYGSGSYNGYGPDIFYGIAPKHVYVDNKKEHTIIFKGKIKSFTCGDEYDQENVLAIDVSKCPALTGLYIYGKYNSLDVSKNTALIVLDIGCNNLTNLNVNNNIALTYLNCSYSKLTFLDVSKNTALTKLNCKNNNLTSLEVSRNTALTELDCSYNNLTSLNISKNTALTYLDCSYNNLTSLNVSKNTTLTYLDCSYNNLTSLNVSKNNLLMDLDCSCNNLTTLDVNSALNRLYCSTNQFSETTMNKIFYDLPFVGFDESGYAKGYINCDDLGDKSIAEEKGWDVVQY